jgi:hypothetical protein
MKQKYLRQPESKTLPYQLGDSQTLDPSNDQVQVIEKILRNRVTNIPRSVYSSSIALLLSCLLQTNAFYIDWTAVRIYDIETPYPIRYTWSDPSSGVV